MPRTKILYNKHKNVSQYTIYFNETKTANYQNKGLVDWRVEKLLEKLNKKVNYLRKIKKGEMLKVNVYFKSERGNNLEAFSIWVSEGGATVRLGKDKKYSKMSYANLSEIAKMLTKEQFATILTFLDKTFNVLPDNKNYGKDNTSPIKVNEQ